MDYEDEPASAGNSAVPRDSLTFKTQQEKVDKANSILDACKSPGNLDNLIVLATSSNGLIDDKVRRVACRLL